MRTVGDVGGDERGLHAFGVLDHGAELEAGEVASAERLALVGKEEGAAILEIDREHDEGIEGERGGEGREGEEDVEEALAGARDATDGARIGDERRLGKHLTPVNWRWRSNGRWRSDGCSTGGVGWSIRDRGRTNDDLAGLEVGIRPDPDRRDESHAGWHADGLMDPDARVVAIDGVDGAARVLPCGKECLQEARRIGLDIGDHSIIAPGQHAAPDVGGLHGAVGLIEGGRLGPVEGEVAVLGEPGAADGAGV